MEAVGLLPYCLDLISKYTYCVGDVSATASCLSAQINWINNKCTPTVLWPYRVCLRRALNVPTEYTLLFEAYTKISCLELTLLPQKRLCNSRVLENVFKQFSLTNITFNTSTILYFLVIAITPVCWLFALYSTRKFRFTVTILILLIFAFFFKQNKRC